MPGTPDRTTIKAAIEALTAKLEMNLVANPPTASKPFRMIAVGRTGAEEYPRPFLALALTRSRPIGAVSDDKLLEVSMELKIVTDVSTADPHDAILDKMGALEDYFDSILDTGVLEGSEGYDDRVWTLDYPRATAGARMATASATQTIVVKVQRQQNREPAS